MKTKIQNWKSEIKAGLMTVLMMVALLLGAKVQAQAPVAPKTGYFTNAPGGLITNGVFFTLRGATTTNINSAWVRLYRGRGLAFYPSFTNNIGTGGSNAIFKFNLCADSNLIPTTVTPLSYTVASGGTTGVVGYTNFFPDTLDNAYAIQVASIQFQGITGTNLILTNMQWAIVP